MLHILRYLQGYRKVNLRDVKGVLNKTNNFKWVRKTKLVNGGTETNTILPMTGTRVRELMLPERDLFTGQKSLYMAAKEIVKANGTTVSKIANNLGAYTIAKYKQWRGVIGNYKVLAQKTVQDIQDDFFRKIRNC